jgi:ABC-type transporter Mla maintaining outer membrane lipid asymmetry ATPase subunit MlaF
VTAVLDFVDVSKDYGFLRPLRIRQLTVNAGEQLAILGLDQPMAEVFVNLATGATLPDDGEVRMFGRPTSAIVDSAEWLAVVDRFGIVSDRAVLLDGLSVIQNLAVPFTLDIEPPPSDVARRAADLAGEVGVPELMWATSVGHLDATSRVRVRLGRALALDPAVLLLDHATASVDRGDVAALGQRVRSVANHRGAAVVAITADQEFATALGARMARLDAATGRLIEYRRSRWFGRQSQR